MFCFNCGAKLEDGLAFCTNCGVKLAVKEEVEDEGTQVMVEDEGTQVMVEDEGTQILTEDEGTQILTEDEGTQILTEDEGTQILTEDEGTQIMVEPAPQPAYEPPVYQQPVYEQPVYQQPVYQQPVYQQPVNTQPQQQAYAYEAQRHTGSPQKVSFGGAIKLFFKNYVKFSGRSTRSEYWWATLFTSLVSLVIYIIPVLGIMAMLAFMLPGLALAVRRLHDAGKSWAYLFMGLIPFAGVIILLIQFCKVSEADNQWGPAAR